VPSQEGRKNPNKPVKEVDEEEEENKMREEAGLTRYKLKLLLPHTVIRFVSTIAKFCTFTVVVPYGTRFEDKMRTLQVECKHFSFMKCPIQTHDGASTKFITYRHLT
jgi:hypothetical protein